MRSGVVLADPEVLDRQRPSQAGGPDRPDPDEVVAAADVVALRRTAGVEVTLVETALVTAYRAMGVEADSRLDPRFLSRLRIAEVNRGDSRLWPLGTVLAVPVLARLALAGGMRWGGERFGAGQDLTVAADQDAVGPGETVSVATVIEC
jgi:hypothetical protein